MVGFSLGLISFFVIPAASVVSRKTKFSDAAPLFYNPLQAILFNSTQRHGGAAFGSIGYLVALILVAPLVLAVAAAPLASLALPMLAAICSAVHQATHVTNIRARKVSSNAPERISAARLSLIATVTAMEDLFVMMVMGL
ncbi:hypothetical protein BD410DRAFT_794225 [Rickenella mellea]|uniref:Uncharacterized protein n=1 Tax=Rickenella mellea TaxID=50990 RepID=A0A4Y7PRQ7_9AGAM|nr:hypothetical protein BD410DRAFT_794225 [Rickenella mellea]